MRSAVATLGPIGVRRAGPAGRLGPLTSWPVPRGVRLPSGGHAGRGSDLTDPGRVDLREREMTSSGPGRAQRPAAARCSTGSAGRRSRGTPGGARRLRGRGGGTSAAWPRRRAGTWRLRGDLGEHLPVVGDGLWSGGQQCPRTPPASSSPRERSRSRSGRDRRGRRSGRSAPAGCWPSSPSGPADPRSRPGYPPPLVRGARSPHRGRRRRR